MYPLKVLSMFDGIAAGRLALKRAGLLVGRYRAFEIDKFAKRVAWDNWGHGRHRGIFDAGHKFVQHGDVRSITYSSLSKMNYVDVDLLLAGSPCQGFSNAGSLLGFDDPRADLFWEFVRVLELVKPTWWLLENVVMRDKWMKIITDTVGVEPTIINSADFSAQNRRRAYWTNIPILPYTPVDTKLTDILVDDNDRLYGNTYREWMLSDRELAYMSRKVRDGRTHWDFHHHSDYRHDKSRCVVANWKRGVPYNVVITPQGVRKFLPVEVERLQTFPDNYTAAVSNTQSYKTLGNSWTVDVVAHIFKGIRDEM